MGEGDLQGNGSGRFVRPGDLRSAAPANEAPPAPQGQPLMEEIHGRSGIQNVDPSTAQPPMRFMEGKPDPKVPDTRGRVWEERDSTGRVRKVHGRPHWQLPADMAVDGRQTMEEQEEAAKEKRRSQGTQTPQDRTEEKAKNRQDADALEYKLLSLVDWAPNVLNNDFMGGVGGAAAVLAFARGPNTAATIARAVKGFAAGSIVTSGMQFAGDKIDQYGCGNDHGGEWKWLTEGVVLPATLWRAAGSPAVKRAIIGSGKFWSVPTAISIGLPVALGLASAVVGRGADKALGTEDRNPTYSNWAQQKWWDSAAVTLAGGMAFKAGGVKPALMAMGAAWAAARSWYAFHPNPTPKDSFDKSLVALDRVQKERSSEAMEEAILNLREFGDFGRTGALTNPLEAKNPLDILDNIYDHATATMKGRANVNSTAPDLYKFATLFPDSRHNQGGYAGTLAHAIVNFEAGQRALKWGAIGVEMPLGNSVGQDTQVDLGGEALRKFITARQEVDQLIAYAQKHDGIVPPGDPSGRPINAAVEVKMLSELRDRIDNSINEIMSPHDKLDQVINDVKDRVWTGNRDAVNELRADVRERAKYPRLKHPLLTLQLQSKLMRDAAMIDLAMAEVAVEGDAKFAPNAQGDSHKQIAFLTSPMKQLPLYFGEALDSLTWSRERMEKERQLRKAIIERDPSQAEAQQAELKRIDLLEGELKRIADRAYALYVKAGKAHLPQAKDMVDYLQRFQNGELMDISADYSNDAPNRAAIRNHRNPIKEELDSYNTPQQQTPAQPYVQGQAEQQVQQQNNAADQQSQQYSGQNGAMQQAEIDYANRREEYAKAHIKEEYIRFVQGMGRKPSQSELEAIIDRLMIQFDEQQQSGQAEPRPEPVQSSNAAPVVPQAPQPMTQPAPQAMSEPVQQAMPSAPPQPVVAAPPETAYQPQQPRLDADQSRQLVRSMFQNFIRVNGRAPTPAEQRSMTQGLNLTPFKGFQRSQTDSSSPAYTFAPQQPVPVIQQAPPDQ